MAASSPAPSHVTTSSTGGLAAAVKHRTDTPPKTLRGLNKPKCIQCGNVARSRCPYQSCKNCCAKAQNPCHIHVLKANATFPEKAQPSSSPVFSQQSTEPSSAGSSLRAASLRQLSSNFAQFNNVQIPLRSRKPLTKKDAAAINEWRFLKLKEFKERNVEIENEAFDRYMQNISLLEEVFSSESLLEDSANDESHNINPMSTEKDSRKIISEMKLKLRSNPLRKENLRKRIHDVVNQGLKKLDMSGFKDGSSDVNDQKELAKRLKLKGWHDERASVICDLNDKLNRARTEEDLRSCLEMKNQLSSFHKESNETGSEKKDNEMEMTYVNDDQTTSEVSVYSAPKLVTNVDIDRETLCCIDAHFSSLVQM